MVASNLGDTAKKDNSPKHKLDTVMHEVGSKRIRLSNSNADVEDGAFKLDVSLNQARADAAKDEAWTFVRPLNLRLVQEWHARDIDNLRRVNWK